MGYIGPIVVEHLRRAHPNAALSGFDTGFFAAALTVPLRFPESVLDEQRFGDVRRPPADLFKGVEGVVHLAAISNDPMGNAFERVTGEINHAATIALAKQAKESGVRSFVFASSCSVYGFAEDGARHEKSGLNPLTAYARSKVASEEGLAGLAGENFQVTCLRFATACGTSPRLRLDLVLNDFVASAIAAKKITMLSDGTPWRPLINVKDMALAIEWALGRPSASGGPFLIVNAGTDAWNYQMKDLALAVQAVMPGVEVAINHAALPDKRSYRVDFGLFKILAPAHQPRQSLSSTIQELARDLSAIGFADQTFRDSKLMRLRMLNALKAAGCLDDNLYWQ